MSQTMRIINKIASILNHKPSDSASSRPSRVVRDSHQTIEGRCITNIPAGTITGLISQRVLPDFSFPRLHPSGAPRDPSQVRHPLMLLASVIPAMLVIPILLTNDSHAYTASITTSGAPSINVKPGTDGGTGTSIGSDAITVTTTCRAGYNLTMSTSVNDNNLYLNGSSSNNTSGQYFTPSDGTTALSSAPNTWGYYFNASSPTTAPTKDSTFNAVPASTSSAAVIKTPTASATDITDNFNVYYGVAVSNNTPLGTYKMIPATSGGTDYGSITYYLTMAESCLPYIVNFNSNAPEGATVTGTMNPQTIGTNDTTALDTNKYEAEGYTFNGWNTAADGTGTAYTDGQSVTNIASPGATITLYAQWEEEASGGVLYDLVQSAWTKEGSRVMTNDTNANTGIQAAITTSNSGVFKYNPSTFGVSSDASNDHDIYFYRGILDTNVGSYGSDGDNAAHPNTVVLDSTGNGKDTTDTCWRIVRTTGSGGVKMIYQGKWTGSTCSNSINNATIGDSSFNAASNVSYKSIVSVGYTFNSSHKTTKTSTAIADLFSTNSTYSNNNADSTIKAKLETWFADTIGEFEYEMEPSAGYCNDRTIYTNINNTVPESESTKISEPYTTRTSGVVSYSFGANMRNSVQKQPPSLTCATRGNVDRGIVDLYTTNLADNGNKQLSKPIALLTADEFSFAGSGYSYYHANSYLRSGSSSLILLSPNSRNSSGESTIFSSSPNGFLSNSYLGGGVRPAISLKSGTTASSGSGTATDPWVVTAPSS